MKRLLIGVMALASSASYANNYFELTDFPKTEETCRVKDCPKALRAIEGLTNELFYSNLKYTCSEGSLELRSTLVGEWRTAPNPEVTWSTAENQSWFIRNYFEKDSFATFSIEGGQPIISFTDRYHLTIIKNPADYVGYKPDKLKIVLSRDLSRISKVIKENHYYKQETIKEGTLLERDIRKVNAHYASDQESCSVSYEN